MSEELATPEAEAPKQGKAGRLFVSLLMILMVGVTALAAYFREHEFVAELLAKDPWISENFGNLHPLVLHLPIGIVFLTVVTEMLGWISFGKWKPVTTLGLFLAVVMGCVACLTGLVDMDLDGYQGEQWIQHMQAGVAFVAVLMLAFLAKIWGKNANGRGFFYGIFLLGAAGIMGFGAHIGGEEIHGAFPSARKNATDELPVIVKKPVPERLAYADVVVPILEAKCYRCHQVITDENGEVVEKSKKGGLVMNSFAALLDGGDDEGPSIIPGNAKESPMMKRIHLPLDDEYHMPPFKKAKPENQLEDAEKEILEWWISSLPKGSETLEDKTMAVLAAPQGIIDAVGSLMTPEERIAMLKKLEEEKKAKELADQKKREKLDSALNALKADEKLSNAVNYVSQDSTDLEFTAVSLRKTMGDEDLHKLIPVADGLTNLLLGSTSVTEPALIAVLPELKELKKLDLSQTSIGDAVLDQVGELENLEWLNLYGTQVTDEGLMKLSKLGKLKKVYLWNSKATPAGAEKLQKALYPLQKPDLDELNKTLPKDKKVKYLFEFFFGA